MRQLGFFSYLRLKIFATLFRVLLRFTGPARLRRDNLLTQGIQVDRKRIQIPSRDGNRFIDADVYSPAGRTAKKSPVLVNWHGSGFIFPMLGSDSLYSTRIVRDTGITVIDADYRKGPETSFPGAVEDVEDVLQWVAAQPDTFDIARVGVSGFSAGGNLALVAASSLREATKGFAPSFEIPIVIAHYPVTDLSIAPEAKAIPNSPHSLPPFMQHLFNDSYVPDPSTRSDPRASPSKAQPHTFPASVVILTCEHDNLKPEASALADALDDGKRKVVNHTFAGVGHGFDKGCKSETNEWEKREEAYKMATRALREAMGL
ncbi:alpha/beta-hydrolase [Massarina eburnea CBS 473.64]|uniref:Alpha/beta-hydrolase n=1 Tax=Massarina eburnea CBS 473.64 TaxID=1395130 RepID=A0A6A6S830_9PLEO|nr:alpha/beta-hydrolase [Massarina eburnea CBS 473.64]